MRKIRMMRKVSCLILLSQLSGLVAALSCRCFPSDSCWPSKSRWAQLNATVGGRLIHTVPLAASCHAPNYNKDECETLKTGWPFAQTHIPSSSSFSSPIAQNQSCDPFTGPESGCSLGNYPVYAINASTADHVAAAVRFASHHNIRLIIKSTGHDLMGRSSGAGSLSIWMHSFQNFTITQRYTGLNAYNGYRGPAIRIEPGLLAYQIFEAARDKGLRVLGGTCPTVSIGGGYTTGGGHGLLSSKYGLGADNVLEWDVVTASGARVTATPKQNSDLYWALSGGGPGVFAVIVGVTVKAFPDGDVSTAALTFGVESSPSEDAFWSAVEAFHSHMPNWLDQNATVAYVYSRGVFSLQPLTLPDQPADSVRALIAPFLTRLDDIKVPYKLNVTTFPTFLDSYAAYQGPLPYGIIPSAEVQASRLVPRSILESEDKVHALVGVQRHIASLANGSFWIVGTGLALPQKPSAAPFNSVLPAWRDAAIHQNIVGQWDFHVPWEENIVKQKLLLDMVLPALTHLTPRSGAYMNEANEDQSDWKEAFYGRNYARLKRVKQIWDPKSMFYVKTGVGSDEWTVNKEGRLCKVR